MRPAPDRAVRAEILAAAGRLLLSEGMGAFTIERVAALAGASKMTVYKWWPSKGVLALEGYASTVDAALAVPDTGDIEADLTTQLLTYVHLLRDTPAGRITAELLGAAQTDPQRRYSGPRRAVGLAALRRPKARPNPRGRRPRGTHRPALGSCLYRLIMGAQPLTDTFARTLVKNLMHGLRASGSDDKQQS